MSWSVELTAWTYLLPGATEWACQYYDPGRGSFIDGGWAWMDDPISFPAITPNPGYLVVLLYDGITTTPWIYSSTFLPSDGDKWRFWLYNHGAAGDLELLNPRPAWTQIAERTGSIKKKAVTPSAWTQIAERTGSIKMKAVTPAAWTQIAERSGSIKMGAITPTGWAQIGQSVSATIKPGFLIPSDFKLVQENVYPDGKTYSGPAQRCFASWSFLPSDFPGATWFTEHLFINHIADKVAEQGEKVLTMKLYEKGTSYILVLETTQTAKSYVQFFPWAIVIVGALVLAIVITLTVLILKTEDFFYNAPLAAAGFSFLILGIAAAAVVGIALAKGAGGKKEKKKVAVPAG